MNKPLKILLWLVGISLILGVVLAISGFFVYFRMHGEAIGAYNEPIISEFQNGDIIFQTSQSAQSKAIQLATNSRYSHVGIILEIDGELI